MKKYILTFALLCSFLFTSAQEVFKNKEVTVSKLKEHVWVMETFDHTTMYIIEGTKASVLIDTGTKCEDLDKIVKKITKKPLKVIVTHCHPDHAGNIKYFKEIWMHANDTILMKKDYDFKGKINFLKNGQTIKLGGINLEIALMPGHTPGSIVVLDKANHDCYSGDAFGSGEVWLQCIPMSPFKVYYESCKRMEKIMDQDGITDIWCGHYPYLKRSLNIDYIKTSGSLAKQLMECNQEGSKPYQNPFIKQAETVRQLAKGFVSIVYDSTNVK